MAFNPTYVNLNGIEAAQLQRRANQVSPLDALISGAQQGLQLQQLPQQLQDQQLARQLNNLLVTQKIKDLQNPQAKQIRDLQSYGLEQMLKNPDLGVTVMQPGLGTIGTPGALTQEQNALQLSQPSSVSPELQAMRQVAADQGGVPLPAIIPQQTASPGLPITEVTPPGTASGVYSNPNIPAQAKQDKFNLQVQLEKLIHPDKTAQPTLYNTAPGHKIVDAQGNIIFENPANSPASKRTVVHPGDTVLDENNNPIFTAPNAAGTSEQDLHGDIQDILEGRNSVASIKTNVGRSKEGTAYLNSIRSGIRAIDPNFDFAASDAGVKSVSSNYVQRATGAINAVIPNIDKIIQLSNDLPRVGIAGVDNLIQKAGVQFGNTKVSNLRQAQKLIADEIGVALGAGSVSDMKLQLGFDVTDPSVSPEVFASNMGIIKEFLNNRKDGLNSLRYRSSTVSPNQTNTPSGNAPVRVNTKAERDALPPGTVYVSPSGAISTR